VKSRQIEVLGNESDSPLLLAVIEATEGAACNSRFRATTVTGNGPTAGALPLERTLEILKKHGALAPGKP
jgi:hypothetical protein